MIAASETINWTAVQDSLRPAYISTDAWTATFTNLQAAMGTTVGDWMVALGKAATYLSSVGIYTPELGRLMSIHARSADAAWMSGAMALSTDVQVAAEGGALRFERSFPMTVHGRTTAGPFGYGWSHSWDMDATTLTNGAILIRKSDQPRLFVPNGNGTFSPAPGDTGVLTQNSGAYRITEADGAITQFLTNGRLNYVEDEQGNRTVASYDNNGRLSRLAHSSGSFISLLYNAAGQIRQVVDGGGQGATYQYDATGQHLASYTDAFGTHRYGYVTGSTPVRNHALQSIELADGSGVFMQYDTLGRLLSRARNAGGEATSFAYEALGSVTVSSATNERITQWFDDLGRLVRHRDVQGNTTVLRYDAADNVSSVILADTLEYEYAYDEDRNVIGTTDPLGYQTLFNYDSNRNLTSTTDALGRTTRYDYDS